MRRFRIRLTPLPGLILGASGLAALALPVWAQSGELRGTELRFGVNLGVEAQSNRSLDPADPGETLSTNANLSFGLLSETPQQRLAFDLSGTLRALSGSGSKELNDGFVNPAAALAYNRSSAAARLGLNASVRETDLADQDNMVFDEETGLFTIVSGSATQRRVNLGGQLDWRDDAPLGFGVSVRYEESTYSGGSATGVGGSSLSDNERLTFGASARLDLSETTRLNSRLSYSTFSEDNVSGSRETISLNNGLVIDRPDGSWSADLGATNTEDGTRVSTSVGTTYETPLTTFSGQIGITRGVTGDFFMNGSLGATRYLPRGSLSLTLQRSVSSGNEQDNEQLNTSLRFGYLHELSELSNMNFAVNWSEAETVSSGLSTTNATFTASYSRAMTPDWNMDMGVRHRLRNDDVEGDTTSNEVFLNLRREFLTRF